MIYRVGLLARNIITVKAIDIAVKVPGILPRAEGGHLGEEKRETKHKA